MGENKPKDKSGSKIGLSASVPSHSALASSTVSSVVLPSENVALQYAMTGDVEKLVQCFTDTADPNHESIGIQINERSCDDGRAPLDWAAILGHADMISELLKRGVDVNAVNEKGYTAAHFAAAWGQVNCLRLLGNNGADLLLKNNHEETPRDVAKRYAQRSCIEYIDWADAKRSLKDCVLAAVVRPTHIYYLLPIPFHSIPDPIFSRSSSSSIMSSTTPTLLGAAVFVLLLHISVLLFQGVSAAQWEILLQNAGIAAMHAAVTHYGNVVFLDRTNIGASQINLPNGTCRYNPYELVLKYDCTAHSVLFIPEEKRVRPLTIQTDTWCSSGQFFANGTLVQTGGDSEGIKVVRTFTPCPSYSDACDWVESSTQYLQDGRWYATNQLLPDGYSQIVLGGRDVSTYEFIPTKGDKVYIPFLQATTAPEYDNLYPFVHLLPSGDLYIFANRDSIIFNYNTNTVVKTFPTIPGEPRNYPSAGSSVMLPLNSADGFSVVEVLVCGGAVYGAALNPAAYPPASITCGRIVVTDANPYWTMGDMPYRRTMGDMLLLPTGNVLIINGAQNGCQGWGNAINAILNPVTYKPDTSTFTVEIPSTIPRVYHSIAVLLPDTRILVAGSNTHQFYTFTGDFPTELRVEAFSPDYLDAANDALRPSFAKAPATLAYGANFTVTINLATAPTGYVGLALLSSPFTTHSFSQGQRMLWLGVSLPAALGKNQYSVTAKAPPYAALAPPSYYMLFPVNAGIPGPAAWVQITY